MYGTQYFKKRSYTFKSFFQDIFRMIKKTPLIRETKKAGRISPQFEKRIILTVTAVNGCRYCEWGHTKSALDIGCSEEEIEQIMINDFSSCDPEEVVALAYAQYYAEAEGKNTTEAWQKVLEFYGEEKAKDIQLFIEMITMGNLLGNTLDAFESRLKGLPPEKGSFLFELFIYSLAFPFVKIFNKKYTTWKNSSSLPPN